jgi:ABC-type Fe3+ transport system substrate-binding protein
MADPADDVLTLAIIGTLYRHYGKEILIDLNNTIPVYKDSGEDLVFTIESGQYSGAIGIFGYFKQSMLTGYPINIFYESYAPNKYAVTTVSGTNIVYIPETSSNKEGSEFLTDFLAKSIFQTFLLNTYHTPIIEVSVEEETGILFPEAPDNTLPFDPEISTFEEVLIIWKEILYPEGAKEIVE